MIRNPYDPFDRLDYEQTVENIKKQIEGNKRTRKEKLWGKGPLPDPLEGPGLIPVTPPIQK